MIVDQPEKAAALGEVLGYGSRLGRFRRDGGREAPDGLGNPIWGHVEPTAR